MSVAALSLGSSFPSFSLSPAVPLRGSFLSMAPSFNCTVPSSQIASSPLSLLLGLSFLSIVPSRQSYLAVCQVGVERGVLCGGGLPGVASTGQVHQDDSEAPDII